MDHIFTLSKELTFKGRFCGLGTLSSKWGIKPLMCTVLASYHFCSFFFFPYTQTEPPLMASLLLPVFSPPSQGKCRPDRDIAGRLSFNENTGHRNRQYKRMKERRERLGWQDYGVERKEMMADMNPKWVLGTLQAFHTRMDGSCIYCLAFTMCQVL